MKYYRITSDPVGIPILWKDLPLPIKEDIPGDIMWNVKTTNELGVVEEKTIVYVEEDKDPDLDLYYSYEKLNDNVTILFDPDDLW